MRKLETFEIVFDNNKTVYYPGQQVSGKCIVHTRGDIKMRALRMHMRGLAKVHWSETEHTTNARGKTTTRRRNYSAENEYFHMRQVLFAPDTGDGKGVLTTGKHEFLFTFKLPPGGLSTSFEGQFGNIRYWLQAEMDRPWAFNKKSKKAFTVISPIDINMEEYLIPIEKTAQKTLGCLCCTSGPVTLMAKSDRTGYCPGESIAIAADFENYSDRTIVPQATLLQRQTFYADGKSRPWGSKFAVLTGETIRPGENANWDAQLLKIPAVSPSILDCRLIRVDYTVKITLEIPTAFNLSVVLPVVIGTVPLRRKPLTYASPVPAAYEGLASPSSVFYPSAPPCNEIESALTDAPPMYAACMDGSVKITDEEDGEMMGDTHFTPMYTYVNDYHFQPPPAYSEVGTYASYG